MRRLSLACLATVACSALAAAQSPQATSSSEDVENGHHLAALICSNCHVASPDQLVQPILRPPAPSFESIARRSDISADTIRTFLATTHRSIGNPAGMPNPQLLDYQAGQVAAYLLSLRESSVASPGREPAQAQPGPCRPEITRLETLIARARASGQSLGDVPESSAARQHHQPTPQSVAQGAREAEKAIETALALARKLETKGLDAECAAMLKKIEPSLGSR
jgi:mono/diheme cytochrome c family protein